MERKKKHQMDMKIFEMLPHSSCAVLLSDIFSILHLYNTFHVRILENYGNEAQIP